MTVRWDDARDLDMSTNEQDITLAVPSDEEENVTGRELPGEKATTNHFQRVATRDRRVTGKNSHTVIENLRQNSIETNIGKHDLRRYLATTADL